MTKLVRTTYSDKLDCRRLKVIFDLGEKDKDGNPAFTIFDQTFTIKVMIK